MLALVIDSPASSWMCVSSRVVHTGGIDWCHALSIFLHPVNIHRAEPVLVSRSEYVVLVKQYERYICGLLEVFCGLGLAGRGWRVVPDWICSFIGRSVFSSYHSTLPYVPMCGYKIRTLEHVFGEGMCSNGRVTALAIYH
jgi:hypothetical protein